jgi:molybdopterin/thiamine biosynthesis adenylyltransferase
LSTCTGRRVSLPLAGRGQGWGYEAPAEAAPSPQPLPFPCIGSIALLMAEIFSSDETRRYARHLVLKGVGGGGQQKLKAARVLIIGAGGLGSPVIAYLAAAGVGTIGVVDDDSVGISNLQRQIVHTSEKVGTPKTGSAGAFVTALNPHVNFVAHTLRLDASNATALVAGYDTLVEGSDSFATRLVAAAAAETNKIPMIAGAVGMFDGQVTVLAPHLIGVDGKPNPRFADLYPETPDDAGLPSCEMVGVLGAVTGVIGTLMAMEVIKLITGVGEPLIGRLLLYDGRGAKFTEFSYKRRG